MGYLTENALNAARPAPPIDFVTGDNGNVGEETFGFDLNNDGD